MQSYIVNLGKYILFNIPIELNVRIDLRNSLRGPQVTMMIPLPENYPSTAIGTSDIVRSKGLFEAELFLITSKNMSWTHYEMELVRNLLGINFSKAVLLDKFYNTAKVENIIITPEESVLLNGLGKRFICLGFSNLINYFDINPNEVPIVLEASGGTFTDKDRLRAQQYLQLGRDQIEQIYQNKYPEDFNEAYINLPYFSDERLVEDLVVLENNERLIRYYTAAFGFQPITYISMGTIMATTVSTFVHNCRST